MDKVKIIIRKEWAEVFKNRMVLFTVIFLPLLFTAIPLAMLFITRGSSMEEIGNELPPQFMQLCPEGYNTGECFQVYIVSQFIVLFMMTPFIIPVNIAAYSIVGEKTTRSLEPLLATPITTAELLGGKNLAAVIPAVIGTWGGFLLFAIGSIIITGSSKISAAFLSPMWLFAIFIVGPLAAVLSVNFSIMVSSRVNDPRVAEQLSVVIIVPVLALFFGQISGLFFLNAQLVLLIAFLVALIDVLMIYLAVRIFQRESILTRWK